MRDSERNSNLATEGTEEEETGRRNGYWVIAILSSPPIPDGPRQMMLSQDSRTTLWPGANPIMNSPSDLLFLRALRG